VSFEIIGTKTVFSGWNRLLLVTARTQAGAVVTRSVEDHGSAVAVLPYDPEARTALLVRQIRLPVELAGEPEAFLEVPAGLMESDDAPDCARREAMEECGLRLGELTAVGPVFPMPGISTERMHLFLARYSGSDRVGEGGGLVEENEEIEVVEVALADLARLVDAGALRDLKTLALVQTLRLREPGLFKT